jgi:hypothetical protein
MMPRFPAASLRPPESATPLPIGGRMRENVLGQVGKRDMGKRETPSFGIKRHQDPPRISTPP